MNKVHLMGDIGDKFGKEWNMDVSSYGDIIKLIDCQTEGFKQYLISSEEKGIGFTVQRAGEYIKEETELLLSLNEEDIIITAVPMGAAETMNSGSGSGWFKIILGVILLIVAWWQPAAWTKVTESMYAAMATLGLNLTMMGIAELNMPRTIGDEDPATLFQGPITGVKQGTPVPVLYGELHIGGSPINVAFTTQNVNLQASAPVLFMGRGKGGGPWSSLSNFDSNNPYDYLREQGLLDGNWVDLGTEV